MDPIEWPKPKSVEQLRAFLGLAGYYRKSVKNFGQIAQQLTNLLKKNSYRWSQQADQAFEELRKTLSSNTSITNATL